MHISSRSSSRARGTVVALAAVTLFLNGCGTAVTNTPTETDASGAVTVENCGVDVTMSRRADHGCGHASRADLAAAALGAGRQPGWAGAGGGEDAPCRYRPACRGYSCDARDDAASREDLLSVEPDFVYSPTTYEFSADQGFASIEQLNDAGAAVYVASGGCQDRRVRPVRSPTCSPI